MKLTSISLSPNTEKEDVKLAFKELFSKKKIKGEDITIFEKEFKNYFNFKFVKSFNSGRSCLVAILSSLDIKKEDEIIVQGFTCNAVINPILSFKAKPIYVDIDDTLNIDVNKVEAKITKRTKAIILQHNFGYPSEIIKIRKLCNEHNIFLIEDCAHALGAKYNNEYCGKFGDIAFFSFGRDKVISSVYGGMVAVNNETLIPKIEEFYNKIDFPEKEWVNKQLRHPVLMNFFVLPFYNFLNIGKVILALSIKFNIISKAVTQEEYEGNLPKYFPKKFPNSLAKVALLQFKKLDRFNNHRIELAKIYDQEIRGLLDIKEGAIYLKYPILVKNREDIIKEMRKFNVMLDDGWNTKAIVPPKTNLCKMNYNQNCPKAEEIANHILILPTHINISKDLQEKIIYLLKSLV